MMLLGLIHQLLGLLLLAGYDFLGNVSGSAFHFAASFWHGLCHRTHHELGLAINARPLKRAVCRLAL